MITSEELAELLGPEDWPHQAEEFDKHKDDRARALFWAMRTGKSKAVIDKFCYQFKQGTIEGVVLLAPNGLHLNYLLNEIPKWSTCPYQAFGWITPLRGEWNQIEAMNRMLRSPDLKWLCMNIEGLVHDDGIKALKLFRRATHRKFALAISEGHHFGRAGAKRTAIAKNLAIHAKFVTIETGTPILNSPLRAYSIFKILDDAALGPKFVGRTYEKFVQHFSIIDKQPDMTKRRSVRMKAYKKIRGYKNMGELTGLMSPWTSVVLRKDVKGMPPLLRTERLLIMSEKQRDKYLEMVSRFMVEIGDHTVTALEGGVRVQKLQQILNGYLMDEGGIVDIDEHAPIYDAIADEVLGTLPGKTLIWCRYREDIRRVLNKLRQCKLDCLQYHGGVPVGQREPIRLAFQNDPKYIACVGHPAAGGEGKDFSAADAVIFFSSTPNAIHVAQGEERATKKDGHPVAVVRFRTPGTVDDRNWDIIDGKVTLADTVSGQGLQDLLRLTNV